MAAQLFKNLSKNELGENIANKFEEYLTNHSNKQIYLITSPLGEKYSYDYEDNCLVILIPKHRIIFLNLGNNDEKFQDYCDDFIEDLNSISDKYNYKEHIGRPRDWKKNNTVRIENFDLNNIESVVAENFLEDLKSQRISDLLISLLIGSINDIENIGSEVPETLLEKVKKNIVLFDGEQTRFMYQDFDNKTITIQGLSGTGKTELLLHKLKDLYVKTSTSKIFFTCHNIALANTLQERVPIFFNFMRVEKQIEWNKRLWVNRAWGSKGDPNSGIYSYLCYFYDIPFLRFSPTNDYNRIFTLALDYIESIDPKDFEYAFDYLLIDERQDFPDVFFQVCEKVTKENVYIAGDIFQDIFENIDKKVLQVDVVLNKCYRTDPRTLMFAHSVGLGLFEEKKLNWFDDDEWNAFGYNVKRLADKEIQFTREPLRRFEDIDTDKFESVEIIKSTKSSKVIKAIESIIREDETVSPNDIAIIILDDDKQIYEYIDHLSLIINKRFGWRINRAHESKSLIDNTLCISNSNNVKGLEFPFVICITGTIKQTYRYRNILYTMLTRSFIKSFLLVNEKNDIKHLEKGLKIINQTKAIKTTEPTPKEQKEIKNNLVGFLSSSQKSYKEFLTEIFDKLAIEETKRKNIEDVLVNANIDKFDEERTSAFIVSLKEYY
ncbi:DEAD/DEAH box helicase [Pedobacter heparinus]|uniref:DNA 3'-5' helicase II n=1 Tax=Pedobacter heparinus (strain ATCC 13125 / DSM 2366 / CIP 104194 / JCM 7457 / NBRC 12017 / NCIMB 9290 / NRRL B-14731 / HIM 762-3) TaxID=485917 RepID=C6XWR5_PEDHD|nr:ATP-binding domain-containing protein [Pedobacter heparinus]ACU04209.1 putative ATP-dependent helicase [Pedobacter heparinus DSM 2366]